MDKKIISAIALCVVLVVAAIPASSFAYGRQVHFQLQRSRAIEGPAILAAWEPDPGQICVVLSGNTLRRVSAQVDYQGSGGWGVASGRTDLEKIGLSQGYNSFCNAMSGDWDNILFNNIRSRSFNDEGLYDEFCAPNGLLQRGYAQVYCGPTLQWPNRPYKVMITAWGGQEAALLSGTLGLGRDPDIWNNGSAEYDYGNEAYDWSRNQEPVAEYSDNNYNYEEYLPESDDWNYETYEPGPDEGEWVE